MSFWAPEMQTKSTDFAVAHLVSKGILAGMYEYFLSVFVWQVSMVITTLAYEAFGTTLAAPQQSPVAHVFSFLAGLKVPFEIAFSHLQPAAPFAGTALASRSATMSLMSCFLLATASFRVLTYSLYCSASHSTILANLVFSLAARSDLSPFMRAK